MSELHPHLAASYIIQSDHPDIRDLADRLAGGEPDPRTIAQSLFEFVRDQIAYSVATPFHLGEHYRASSTLERGTGYCVQKAVLLTTLARAAGIPARLAFADIRNHRASPHLVAMLGTNLFVYHAYSVLFLEDRWMGATPTFDQNTCDEHQFPLVCFNGHQDALLPATDPQGRRFVEYVTHHGILDDVPMDALLAAWRGAYGDERVDTWILAAQSLGS